LSQEALNDILWWKENIAEQNGKDIRPNKIYVYLETGASNSGWGEKLNGKTTGGRWLESESAQHINFLELRAVKFALQSLYQNLSNIHICIRSDNSTAVSYISNQGGSIVSLLKETQEIWLWCNSRNIFISSVHIAGKNNITADYMSRNFSDSTEWKLNESTFTNICANLFYPDVDLFASILNKQLNKYVSWFPDPKAVTPDAFSIC